MKDSKPTFGEVKHEFMPLEFSGKALICVACGEHKNSALHPVERHRARVHMDCSKDHCMLGDPVPCALFTQEIDADDLRPQGRSSYVASALQIRQVYELFTRALNLLNQNVPEGERLMMPFVLQGVIHHYIEEREAIESIEKSARDARDA